MRRLVSPLDGIRSPFGPRYGTSFSPASLFAAGEQGAWYDPSDLSTMFQDSAGTTPVTAVEQPVGLVLDKSKGLVLGDNVVTNGDFSSAAGWTLDATASITGGELVFTSSTVTATAAYRSALTQGKWYKIVFVVSQVTAGTVSVVALGGTNGTPAPASAVGTYVRHVYIGVANANIGVSTSGFTGKIDNISAYELPGNHASQSTAASRPVLSARVNQLTYSEQFDNAAWPKVQLSVADNQTTDPLGGSTADRLTATVGTNARYLSQAGPTTISGVGYTFAFYAKAGTHSFVQFCTSGGFGISGFVNFDLSTGTVGTSGTFSSSIFAAENGWYRCVVTMTATSAAAATVILCMVASSSDARAASWTAAGTETVFLWGADLRPTDQTTLLPAYQRIAAATDYDTTGFPYYLRFDGTDDSMATGTITPGIDKAQVFSGVRKQNDTVSVIAEMSITINNNAGSFLFLSGTNNVTGFEFTSRGSDAPSLGTTGRFAVSAPVTVVDTGIADISAPLARIRINGVTGTDGTSSQGTGNFLAYPLYIGSRGGGSPRFNGNIYSLIVRFGSNLDATTISNTETYVNSKTLAY